MKKKEVVVSFTIGVEKIHGLIKYPGKGDREVCVTVEGGQLVERLSPDGLEQRSPLHPDFSSLHDMAPAYVDGFMKSMPVGMAMAGGNPDEYSFSCNVDCLVCAAKKLH